MNGEQLGWRPLTVVFVCVSLLACSRSSGDRPGSEAGAAPGATAGASGGASGASGGSTRAGGAAGVADAGSGARSGGGGGANAEGGLGGAGAEGGGVGGAGAEGGGAGAGGAGAEGGAGARLEFGYPVYSQGEIDSWSTSSAEYARLASSWAGNVERTYAAYGEEISSVERDILKDESVYLKVQAVLYAADGNATRSAKVAALLDELRSVTSWEWDAGEQYRLVAGWSCTNLAQAAALTGYRDDAFTRFLVEECYPILDWTNGPNWHGSFADSRLAIAAYVGDAALWQNAKDYFHTRLGQSIYHSAYDGGAVRPLLNDRGSPHVGLTMLHWGGGVGAAQINEDFTPVAPQSFPDGVNAERMRDLGHVSMGLGAFMQAARTILAQKDVLEPHAYARLREAYAHHGDRVLAYLNTGTVPEPAPVQGDGGGALRQSWLGACKILGDDTPPDVLTLCDRDEVTGFAPAGANHLVAEPFVDER